MAKLLSITGALLLGLAGAAAAQPADQIPMRDFFRNPDRAFYRISGDGKTLSFMQPWERRMNIFVQPVGSAQDAFGPGGARRTIEARIARVGPGVVRLVSWKEVH